MLQWLLNLSKVDVLKLRDFGFMYLIIDRGWEFLRSINYLVIGKESNCFVLLYVLSMVYLFICRGSMI